MPTFVDYAGMYTLISSFYDDAHIIRSETNSYAPAGTIPTGDILVAINIHMNGPYGYSSWRQLRVSENPMSRGHKKINKLTFVTEGPVRTMGEGTNNIVVTRDRYSALYKFTEPAVVQKSHPIIWNVGRHFKDEDGNVDYENPERFSIISSYGNRQLGFANEKTDFLLRFKFNEEQTEYNEISKMYLDNGLNRQDSPLTHWEFLQYRETIFPKSVRQYVSEVRDRPQFKSFYRHIQAKRIENIPTSSYGFTPKIGSTHELSQSTWPLDEANNFLTRTFAAPLDSIKWGTPAAPGFNDLERRGEGVLMNTLTQFAADMSTWSAWIADVDPAIVELGTSTSDGQLSPSPLYSRRTTVAASASFSNPSGIEVAETGNSQFAGGALWEAGATREVKDKTGAYVSSPKLPFYDSYSDYALEVKNLGKNYTVIPEYRMSSQVRDLMETSGKIEIDQFEVSGGIAGSEDSSTSEFYNIYSNTDFLKQFEIINDDHKEFTNGKVLSLRCKAIKKLLPYEGFYPCQRTAQLTQEFYNSYGDNIAVQNALGTQLSSHNLARQFIMAPLFAPGILFNTIKSGVAVDYPILSSSSTPVQRVPDFYIGNEFDRRIPFEALIEPENYLSKDSVVLNEPHPYASLSASAVWTGEGDRSYSKMMNNFLASSIEFFLEDGNLTSLTSKRQKDMKFNSGSVYGMRVLMRRSMKKGARKIVHHDSKQDQPYYTPQDIIYSDADEPLVRESFTMYSRPSAFGPPTIGTTVFAGAPFEFETDRTNLVGSTISKDSADGYNFPFTPPYYHGESWCDIFYTASSDNPTISDIQENATYTYSRFDYSHYTSSNHNITTNTGAQAMGNINNNAVQLSSSLNMKGVGTTTTNIKGEKQQSLVVDSGLAEDSRWIIQTKFETPMLNFSHISASAGNLTLPVYGASSVPRGMWHQYGRIPEASEGVFIEASEIPENYQKVVLGNSSTVEDLSKALGFSNQPAKIGKTAPAKTISEGVVAVPFIEEEGKRKFFKLDPEKVRLYKDGELEALTSGDPQSQVGRSVLHQMDKMKKFIFPPSFDFLNFDNIDPIAMYVFDFSHTLTQQDLSDIWQNLPPDIGQEMEVSEIAITHPLLKKELIGPGGQGGNKTIDMPEKLMWMVFKVKQRSASNYYKKTILRNPEVNTPQDATDTTQDEFGPNSAIQYNWPYDFFSLVEMVKIDAEVEFGNFKKEDLDNYTDNIPRWDAKQADLPKIDLIVGGIENDDLFETDVVEVPPEQPAAVQSATAPRKGKGSKLTPFERLSNSGKSFTSGVATHQGSSTFSAAAVAEAQAEALEDELRSKYVSNAQKWVSDYNQKFTSSQQTATSNGTASRLAYGNDPQFAVDFSLTDNQGVAIRTSSNLKQELMMFFRITE